MSTNTSKAYKQDLYSKQESTTKIDFHDYKHEYLTIISLMSITYPHLSHHW